MKHNWTLRVLLVLDAILLLACSEQNRRNPAGEHATPFGITDTGYYDSNAIAVALSPGMRREEVIKLLGNPLVENELDTGLSYLAYNRSPEMGRPTRNFELVGFNVILRSNLVTEWHPVLSANDGQSGTVGRTSDGAKLPVSQIMSNASDYGICIFLVSETPIEGGTLIDTPEMPKLGFVAAKPNLSLRSLRFVRKLLNKSRGAIVDLLIGLSQKDARALRDFTETNYGKEMLVMIGNIPIAAPRIENVINTPAVLWTLRNETETEEVLQMLRKGIERAP